MKDVAGNPATTANGNEGITHGISRDQRTDSLTVARAAKIHRVIFFHSYADGTLLADIEFDLLFVTDDEFMPENSMRTYPTTSANPLDVVRLEAGRWMVIGFLAEYDKVRSDPFQDVAIELSSL